MKMKDLLAALAVLVICAACAPAVAAPEPTPTLVSIPTPVGTPDPLWVGMSVELQKNVGVCLEDSNKIKATLLTGPVMVTKLIWVTLAEGIQTHTVVVGETQKETISYEVFPLGSEKDLAKFDRVFVCVTIGDRKWEFGFPVESCTP